MNVATILVLGFFLGMRHATDADHVTAVSTIVTRERTLRAALPVGVLWGLGHTVTIMLVGGAIVLFGLVIPARVGLGMEMSVGVMLVVLGALNLRVFLGDMRGARGSSSLDEPVPSGSSKRYLGALRPLIVGVVHGLAGSAAVALLVLASIRSANLALVYLLVFGFGSIAGMALITIALAAPLALAARFDRLHRALALGSGLLSVGLGTFLVYEMAFVHGLFGTQVHWAPR
jgi:high-affinity nickel permease